MDYKDMWITLKTMISDEWDISADRLNESIKCRAYSDCIKYDTKMDVLEYVIKTMRTIQQTSEKYDKN